MRKSGQIKQNTIILILFIIIIIIAAILVFYVLRSNSLITGNVIKEGNTKEAVVEKKCSSPYILIGDSCCLDTNNNNICDKDEGSYCGDGLCNTNERAIQCSDCYANLRIENIDYGILGSRQLSFRIRNYNVIKLGDPVAVYPSIDIYAGYSDKQCKGKNLLQLYRKDFDCTTNCYYIVDQDKIGKSYPVGSISLASEFNEYQNPDCIYFVFGLKPYDNINGERLVVYESQLIDLRYALPPVSTIPVSVY